METVAGDVTLTPGQATVITAQNVDGTVTFATSGPGVSENTLTSIAFAAAVGSDTAVKQADENRTAQATFTAPTAGGTYVVTITDGDGDTDSITLTVAAASSGGTGGTGGSLPATGGDAVPAAAIWLGAGAVGLGGIAVTAAVARRRAAANR
ncbi:hypothetical protein [Microbacterium sp. SLBN-154]|uniref:hypothetical protein n=1 Tax=Microbacterium sp. SLBN-154 TaxID=2768458 RepID=UPI0011532E20|nr:hypothetical protein [Microbacterium sp. SLBN-154]